MILIMSPTKTFKNVNSESNEEFPLRFEKETEYLVNIVSKLSKDELSKLMKTSEELTELNFNRYNKFYTEEYCKKTALRLFYGEAFKGLDADTLSKEDFDFAEEHLRILSGLYGVIKPLDKIKEYRLEMGSKLKNECGKDLYCFWKNKITDSLIYDLEKSEGERVIINLASGEYSKAIDLKKVKESFSVVEIEFKENRNDEYKVIGTYAKKARGLMVRYIIQNRINNVEGLKRFNIDGYLFNEELSDYESLVFTR